MEREQGRKDATADLSSDLSEGERDSTPADGMPRVESSLTLSSSNAEEASASDREKPVKNLYIVLLRCVRGNSNRCYLDLGFSISLLVFSTCYFCVHLFRS